MDKIAFAPLIDVPLVVFTAAACVWHFGRWAVSNDVDPNMNLVARLPIARLRAIALFVAILLLCWLLNLAVWSLFALLLGVGIAIAFLVGGAPDGGAVGLWAAAQLIREWSFGFPHLILHPPGPSVDSARLDQRAGELLGKTGTVLSSLRPMGDADIEGVKMAVSSADGQWIETGTEVTVTAYRNGRPCVTPNS